MNKKELVEKVAKAGDLSQLAVKNIVDDVFETIKHVLSEGEPVAVNGFGTFSVRERKAYMGHNPQTGAKINIDAAKIPGFKAGQALKDAVK